MKVVLCEQMKGFIPYSANNYYKKNENCFSISLKINKFAK